MHTWREPANADRARRVMFWLALTGMSVAGLGGGREVQAQPVAAPQAKPAGREDVHRAVEAFVTTYLDAYNRKDAAAVAALYAEDGVLVPPGPIATGRLAVENAWRAVFDSGRTGLRYDIRRVEAAGDLVWSVGGFTVMVPDDNGVLQERQGNFANIYQWAGDKLRFRVHAFNFLLTSRPQ